jgi:choice-of-anchor B domain-containing protein
MNKVMPMINAQTKKCKAAEGKDHCPVPGLKKLSNLKCVDKMSGEYPCHRVNLESFMTFEEMGAGSNGRGSDIWGWTDSDGKEYALFQAVNGAAFVDVTDSKNPKALGFMPATDNVASTWRDVKVYKDHAFVVSEASTSGMQIFDLTRLRGLDASSTRQFTPDALYAEVGSTHNIVINEATGYAYLVGTRTCSGGLHMVDISTPTSPKYAGCYSEAGYTHDAECVVYSGPDTRYTGKDVCFNYNEDRLVIVDVTDKKNPVTIAEHGYNDDQYTHQGWLTPDHTSLLLDDELDEVNGPNPHTRTLIWDVSKLDSPVNSGDYFADSTVIDHNLYIKGNLAYMSNYCDGLRVFDVSAIKSANIQEVAYYDVHPDCDTTTFAGTWSNYPYFASGTVVLSSIERGLFVFGVDKEVVDAADARKVKIDAMYAKGMTHAQVNAEIGFDSHVVLRDMKYQNRTVPVIPSTMV